MKKILVIQVAALGYDFAKNNGLDTIGGCGVMPMKAVFPAVTCTAQATLRTAAAPGEHGMVANGLWDATLQRPSFWEQSCKLISGPRIWDAYRMAGGTVGMTFFQQSLGENVDALLSPAPIHKHGGGMIMGCYSKPDGLIENLTRAAGRAFRLSDYWGPLASARGSDWIADAITAYLADTSCPSLLFTYLPALDYDLQRHGPNHPKSVKALIAVKAELEKLCSAARRNGYEIVVFGDYAITPVTKPAVFPNRALREAGFFKTRSVAGMAYPDFYQSRAFAVCDHQIAMVQCTDPAAVPEVADCLQKLPGVGDVIDSVEQAALNVRNPRTGSLLLVAEAGTWFAYPWWSQPREAPDFAAHVDIHNKPGYDPCELFFAVNPFHVSQNAARIRGTHGRASGEGLDTAFASTLNLDHSSLLAMAKSLAGQLLS